jgi:hypothetical protein
MRRPLNPELTSVVEVVAIAPDDRPDCKENHLKAGNFVA